jgi:hypothetical protein
LLPAAGRQVSGLAEVDTEALQQRAGASDVEQRIGVGSAEPRKGEDAISFEQPAAHVERGLPDLLGDLRLVVLQRQELGRHTGGTLTRG